MKLEKHVLSAIDAWGRGDKEEALMHASFAIDATARNLYSKARAGRNDYLSCLREYWWIIERFIGGGLNLEDTKFTHLKLKDDKDVLIPEPDLADVVYHIFRCKNAHADEIPKNYELLPSKPGGHVWLIDRVNNSLRMPDTIVWALLAVSVFCKANAKIKTEGEYWLEWGSEGVGFKKFLIREFWGQEVELKSFFSDKPQTRIKLDNL